MQEYHQYCPIAKATEILAERWTLLIVRELMHGSAGFNEVHRNLPGVSRSLLAERLRMMERSGLLVREINQPGRGAGYHLTAAGASLATVVDAVGAWGAEWVLGEPRPEELDPYLLLVWMSRTINFENLPPQRVVVEFRFPLGRPILWLVLDRDEASVCRKHPGFEVDLTVHSDRLALYDVYHGRKLFSEVTRAGLVRVEGPTFLVRAFPRWFAWSKFAPIVRGALKRQAAAGNPA